jgi:hypothetical protein
LLIDSGYIPRVSVNILVPPFIVYFNYVYNMPLQEKKTGKILRSFVVMF